MFSATSKDDNLSNSNNNPKNPALEMTNDMRSAADNAGRKARRLYDSVSDELTHASDTVTSEIRSNPLRSSVIALGAGMLLGMLFRR